MESVNLLKLPNSHIISLKSTSYHLSIRTQKLQKQNPFDLPWRKKSNHPFELINLFVEFPESPRNREKGRERESNNHSRTCNAALAIYRCAIEKNRDDINAARDFLARARYRLGELSLRRAEKCDFNPTRVRLKLAAAAAFFFFFFFFIQWRERRVEGKSRSLRNACNRVFRCYSDNWWRWGAIRLSGEEVRCKWYFEL